MGRRGDRKTDLSVRSGQRIYPHVRRRCEATANPRSGLKVLPVPKSRRGRSMQRRIVCRMHVRTQVPLM